MVRPSATVDLKGDDTHLNRTLANGEKRVKGYAANVGRALKSVARAAAIVLPAAGLAFAAKSVTLAREQIQAERKLEAVIRATGGAAGFTADELKKMAADLQLVTNFGDEVTISALAVLATFKEIKGDVFREAIKSAQDMSAVLGTDLQGSVLQLGKALNDPIKGITALSRAGVSFTQDQKDLIRVLQESGDIMGAQQIILAELKGEFGGAAQEVVDPLTQAFNRLGDSMEEVGVGLIPHLNAIADASQGVGDSIAWVNLQYLKATRALNEFDRATSIVDRPELDDEIAVLTALIQDLENKIAGIDTSDPLAEARGRRGPEAQELLSEREGRPVSVKEVQAFMESDVWAKHLEAQREAATAANKLAMAQDDAAKAAEDAATKQAEAADKFEERLRGIEGIREPVRQPIPEPAPIPGQIAPEKAPADILFDRIFPPPEPEPFQPVVPRVPDRDRSADQIALDKLVVDPGRREELQGIIDENARKKEQRELDLEGERLTEELETPFEKLEKRLARLDTLFGAGAIDEDTFVRAITEAERDFQADIPDFGPSAADDQVDDLVEDRDVDDVTEDRGFQARFEGITAAFTRISTAAASRAPEDRAIKAAERSATATEDSAGKLADLEEHTKEQNGILIELRDQPAVGAIAG